MPGGSATGDATGEIGELGTAVGEAGEDTLEVDAPIAEGERSPVAPPPQAPAARAIAASTPSRRMPRC